MPHDTDFNDLPNTVVEESSEDGVLERSDRDSEVGEELIDDEAFSEPSSSSSEATECSLEDTDDDFIVADDESCIANADSESEYIHSSDDEDIGATWVNGHKEYEVEQIISHRVFPDATYYLVRWAGYTAAEDHWLSASELRHAKELLQEYKESVGLE